MARPRKQDQFAEIPENDCDERVIHIAGVLAARSAQPTAAALDAVELCVCDLSATIGISESAVSHQLRQMRDLNVVRGRRDGRRVFYSLTDEHVMSIYRQARDHV